MTVLDGSNPLVADEPADDEDIEPAEDEQDETPASPDDGELEGEGDGEQPSDVEVEVEGKKFRVPAELKDRFMADRDYRHKTMTLAEERRQVADKAKAIEDAAKSLVELKDSLGALHYREARVKYWQNVDWDKYNAQNPQAAQRDWMTYQREKESRDAVAGKVEKARAERSQRAEQEAASRLQDTVAYAKDNIKGWTPELDREITQHARTAFGFTDDELLGIVNRKVYPLLYKAMLWDRRSSQKPSSNQNTPSEPPVKPIQSIARGRGSTASSRPDDRLSVGEWMKRREKQVSSR